MSDPTRKLAQRVGYESGRPVYAEDGCDGATGLGQRVGHESGRPVYATARCSAGLDDRALAQRTGYASGRPVYATACCLPSDSRSASPRPSSSSRSPSASPSTSSPFPSPPSISRSSLSATISTSCCAEQIPATLYVTYTNISNCSCMDGVTVQIDYDAINGWWQGTLSAAFCGYTTITVRWSCTLVGGAPLWTLRTACDTVNFTLGTTNIASPPPCDPFEATVASISMLGTAGRCCSSNPAVGGFLSAVVSE